MYRPEKATPRHETHASGRSELSATLRRQHPRVVHNVTQRPRPLKRTIKRFTWANHITHHLSRVSEVLQHLPLQRFHQTTRQVAAAAHTHTCQQELEAADLLQRAYGCLPLRAATRPLRLQVSSSASRGDRRVASREFLLVPAK